MSSHGDFCRMSLNGDFCKCRLMATWSEENEIANGGRCGGSSKRQAQKAGVAAEGTGAESRGQPAVAGGTGERQGWGAAGAGAAHHGCAWNFADCGRKNAGGEEGKNEENSREKQAGGYRQVT